MRTYGSEGVYIRHPEDIVGLSVSKLLSSEGTFSVKVAPGSPTRELFALISPIYQLQLVVGPGTAEFRRNEYVARAEAPPTLGSYRVLAAWTRKRIQLAIINDDAVGPDNVLVTVETSPIDVPIELQQWARRQNLLARKTYESGADFLAVFIEAIRQVELKIRNSGSARSFWDAQRGGESPRWIPKREVEAMATFASHLYDHGLLAGYELLRESSAGAGSLDLRAIAPLTGGGQVSICIEGKNAHSPDVERGVRHQLPEYMRAVGSEFGIYLVLWYRCAEFDEPKQSSIDLSLRLARARGAQTISVEQVDLGIPRPPSERIT